MMVLDSLNVIGDECKPTVLTPNTLKTLTQIFESEDCIQKINSIKENVSPSIRGDQRILTYCGGTTTVVTPVKVEPEPAVWLEAPSNSETFSEENYDDSDEDYVPVTKMQTRNGGKRKSNPVLNNNYRVSKVDSEPVAKKRRGNMKNDYDTLPPGERDRLKLRRERNKQAAARCRQRREDLTKSLMEQVNSLEGKNSELEEEVKKLKSLKQELEYILQAHSASCGLTRQANSPRPAVAVKSEPNVIVESIEAPYTVPEQKRHRPSSLTIPATTVPLTFTDQCGPAGVMIETPSNILPSYDNIFGTSTGMTPPVSGLNAPLFFTTTSSTLNTPVIPNCSSQQRSTEIVADLNTPGETVSLVSL